MITATTTIAHRTNPPTALPIYTPTGVLFNLLSPALNPTENINEI